MRCSDSDGVKINIITNNFTGGALCIQHSDMEMMCNIKVGGQLVLRFIIAGQLGPKYTREFEAKGFCCLLKRNSI